MLKSLWVMRHGLAESNFQEDFSRKLSNIGAQEVESVSEQIKLDGGVQPLNILASPFARTQSTAQIVHSHLGIKNNIQTDEMLVHFADHRVLGEYLLNCNFEYLIIVSHMPIVAYLCRYLCSDGELGGFQTAQTVRLDFLYDKNLSDRVQVKHFKTYFPKLVSSN